MTVAASPVLDPPRTLSANVRAADDISLRGFVETADRADGLTGWAFDTAHPDRPVLLEIMAGDSLLAKIPTTLPRRDVAASGAAIPAGFRVSPARLAERLARLGGGATGTRLSVRVAGTPHMLGSRRPLPLVGELRRLLGDVVPDGAVPDVAMPDGAVPAGPATPSAQPRRPAAPRGELTPAIVAAALPDALQRLADAAEALLRVPLTPANDRIAGFLEEVTWEHGGLVWFFGWMRRHLPLHGTGVITDGAKFPTGYAVATFPRPDLPEGAHGVAGVLRTDWRPTPGRTPMLFLGEGAAHCLRGLETLALRSDAELVARLGAVGGELGGPYVGALRALLASDLNWMPDNARAAGIEARASLDRVLVLPGFGCLAEGWVLSPLRRVERFMLRAGSRTMLADARSGSRKPRADLLASAPHGQRMIETAGFFAAFPGAPEEADLGLLTLKLMFADGASSNHRVEPGAVRVLGASAGWDEVLQLFPAIHAEPFFPAFARAVGVELRRTMTGLTGTGLKGTGLPGAAPGSIAVADQLLVVVVPDDPHDLHLLFAELALVAVQRPTLPALLLLAAANESRATVLTLRGELGDAGWGEVGLLFLTDPAYALHALPAALDQADAVDFGYLAAGLFPSAAGWEALLDRLAGRGGDAFALPVEGPPGVAAPVAATPECFVWRRAAFEAWLAAQPVLLGGVLADRQPLPANALHAAPPAVARRGRRAGSSRFAQRLNDQLLAEAPHA